MNRFSEIALDIEEEILEKELSSNEKLLTMMVGSLYPSILRDRNWEIIKRIAAIKIERRNAED